MKKKIAAIISILAGLFIIVGIFGEVLSFCCLDEDFYINEYEKMNTAEDMGMRHEELMEATNVLLDYLKDKRDDISLKVHVNGEEVEMFDNRETLHMIDVKALYLNAITVTRILLAIGLCAFAVLLIIKSTRRQALRGYHIGNIVFLGIIALLGIYALLDFNSFWTSFHKVFFTNDLWLLYPDERLIQMVPEQFFSDLVARIVLLLVIFAGIPAAVCAFFRVHIKKKEAEDGVR